MVVSKCIKGQTKTKLLKLKLVWQVQSQYFVAFILLLLTSCLQAAPSIFYHAIALKQHFDFSSEPSFSSTNSCFRFLCHVFDIVTLSDSVEKAQYLDKMTVLDLHSMKENAMKLYSRGIGVIRCSDKHFLLLGQPSWYFRTNLLYLLLLYNSILSATISVFFLW